MSLARAAKVATVVGFLRRWQKILRTLAAQWASCLGGASLYHSTAFLCSMWNLELLDLLFGAGDTSKASFVSNTGEVAPMLQYIRIHAQGYLLHRSTSGQHPRPLKTLPDPTVGVGEVALSAPFWQGLLHLLRGSPLRQA